MEVNINESKQSTKGTQMCYVKEKNMSKIYVKIYKESVFRDIMLENKQARVCARI